MTAVDVGDQYYGGGGFTVGDEWVRRRKLLINLKNILEIQLIR
jgi:hypothetical protein